MADNKIKYELSLWQDVTPDGGIDEPYLEEKKIAVIGGDNIDTPIKAYNVTEKQQISGADSLTFNMVRKYWKDGELVDNPFTNLLNVEAKIKLRIGEPYNFIDENGDYDADAAQEEDIEEKWHDYILKKIDVDRNSYVNTYTCDSAFPVELGRNGWNVTLDTELENNYGSLYDLTTEVLKNTDIGVSGYVYPTEKLAEQLFAYELKKEITVHHTIDINNSEDSQTIEGTDANPVIIYFFYSGVELNDENQWIVKSGEHRILYREKPFTIYDCDDNYIVIDYDDAYQYDVIFEPPAGEGEIDLTGQAVYPVGSLHDPANTGYALQGKKIIKSVSSHFEPVADRYVYDYTCKYPQEAGAGQDLPVNSTVFSYNETKYYTTDVVKNYITNHTGFTGLVGWRPENIDLIQLWPQVQPGMAYENPHLDSPISYLKLRKKGVYFNTSFEDLKPIKNDIYVIRVRARKLSDSVRGYQADTAHMAASISTNTNSTNTELKLNVGQCDLSDPENPTITSFLYDPENETALTNGIPLAFEPNTNLHDGDDFDTEKLIYGFPAIANQRTPLEEAQLNTFYNDDLGYAYAFVQIKDTVKDFQKIQFIFEMTSNAPTDPNYSYSFPWHIQDIQFFKYVEDDKGYPMFPEDVPMGYYKIIQHFYYVTADKKIQELSNNTDYYEQQYMPNYAAVRNLTVSESNYFNIINSLSELFEVWVRFKLYHTKDGHILFENGKPKREVIYSQYAPFEEYNWAGFRYRQNLANIKKNVDATEITTKMIVQNNSNEFATDGVCSVTRAVDNPSGENILYNFDYYINMGLLDGVQVMADLYELTDEDSDEMLPIGYYPNMRAINDQLVPLNERINAALGALYKAKEMYNYANISYDSALEEYRKALSTYNSRYDISSPKEREILWRAVIEAKAKMDQFEKDKLEYENQTLEYEKLLYGNIKIADLDVKPYYKGEFDNQITYAIGDLVTWKNKLYYLKKQPKYLTWFPYFGYAGPLRPPGANLPGRD